VADLVYPPVIGLVRATFAALGLRFTVSGEEHVPRTGGAVMAINHTGYLDFTFAGLPARKHRRLVRFMAKDVTFKHPVSGPLMRGMHHIPVNREAGAAAYDAAVQALRAGEIVGVFPETTMSPSFELLPFKQGAARMAQQAGVPILPTVIWGSQRVLTYGRRRPVSLKTIPLSVDVGAPVVVAPDEDPATATRRLRAHMERMLHAAQERYPDRPADDSDRWWLPARLGGSAPTAEEGLAMVRAKESRRRASGDPPSR
jgi:1-acyl-sn-glycerol-3-phosphate acyltransferase